MDLMVELHKVQNNHSESNEVTNLNSVNRSHISNTIQIEYKINSTKKAVISNHNVEKPQALTFMR